MKTLLAAIVATADSSTRYVTIGEWDLFAYTSDGTITAVRHPSGLQAPSYKPNLAGLRRLLGWMDENNSKPNERQTMTN